MNDDGKMKKRLAMRLWLYYCWVSVFIYSLFFYFGLQPAQGQENCRNVYEKMSQYYQKYVNDKLYFKYSAHSVLNGEQGEKVLFEIWGDGKKAKLANQFVTVFQDEKDQVVILKNKKMILVRNAKDGEKINAGPKESTIFQDYDNMIKNIRNIECTEKDNTGSILFIYDDNFIRTYSIKTIAIHYDNRNELITKGVYEYHLPDGNELKEIYDYLNYSQNVDSEVFAESALGHIYKEGQLKNEYRDFKIKDLRGKNRSTQDFDY